MKIRKNLVSSDKYSIKCPYKMSAKYITIHNTANDASAENEIAYMIRNNYQISYHFAVDDKEVVQGLPLDRNGWHCGDGKNGPGNRQSIGVEICYSLSGGERYKKAEKNAIKFVAQLLHERGWGIDGVKKHQDWNGKYCPHRILSEGRWNSFKKAIENELATLKGKQSQPAKKSSGKPKNAYTGNSIVDYLKSIGVDSSFANRKKLAQKYGIKNYTGTAAQNTQLLNAIRNGSKPKPASKPKKTIAQMAEEIIAGKHGNGHENRRKSLGIDKATYQKVRAEVNKRLRR